MPSPFDASYTTTLVRFWRIPWHREALNTLAIAVSHSAEADYLGHEWELIQSGNHAEFELRHKWEEDEPTDPWGWRDTETWHYISTLYGPPHARHSACLCKWLHGRPYPVTTVAHGGSGDAGGRARRLIADLDSAVAVVPIGPSERANERAIAKALGWMPQATTTTMPTAIA